MSCEHTRDFLDAYLDGELDAQKSLEIERHLGGCAACQTLHEQRRRVCAVVQSRTQYFFAPELSARRLRASLDRAEVRRPFPARWGSLAATAVIAAVLGSGVTFWFEPAPGDDALVQAVVAGHARSLMVAGRITDISSSDQHTVKPWFNGRVDYSPPVVNLTAKGFALVGGRLDYLDRRPVAALVYRHRQHLINLFIWPDEKSAAAPTRAFVRHGYHVLHWSVGGMRYWAISDLNPDDLKAFGDLLKPQTAS